MSGGSPETAVRGLGGGVPFPKLTKAASGLAAALTRADSEGSRSCVGTRGGERTRGGQESQKGSLSQEESDSAAVISDPQVSGLSQQRYSSYSYKVGCGFGGPSPPHRDSGPSSFYLPAPSPQHKAHAAIRQRNAYSLVLAEQSLAWNRHLSFLVTACQQNWPAGLLPQGLAGVNELTDFGQEAPVLFCSPPAFPKARAGVRLRRKPLPPCLIPEETPNSSTCNTISLQIRVPCAGAL